MFGHCTSKSLNLMTKNLNFFQKTTFLSHFLLKNKISTFIITLSDINDQP